MPAPSFGGNSRKGDRVREIERAKSAATGDSPVAADLLPVRLGCWPDSWRDYSAEMSLTVISPDVIVPVKVNSSPKMA